MAKRLKPKERTNVLNVKSLEAILNEIKSEVGLNDNDVTIIAFTSVDQDHLTNLLVLTSEFLKWFIMNFAGESRAESDFLESKKSIWRSSTVLAEDVLTAYKKLSDPE